MKIQLCSDLHLEFEPVSLPVINKDADVIVYAGDIATHEDVALTYFQEVREQTNALILYVMGNHEFYGKFLHSVSDYKLALREVPGLVLLDCDVFNYRGVRFLGCTLWTDFDDRKLESRASSVISDYKKIRKIGKYYELAYITPGDILEEHRKCREFLRKEFYHACFHPGPVVVITHHGPSFYCVDPQRKNSELNGFFYVELSDMIMSHKPKLWLYGHDHTANDVLIGKTRLVRNPSGYPFETNNSSSSLIIEVI